MFPLQPWIQECVIGLAEQYGVDYFNAPPHAKQRTVQIIEFLHRGVEGQKSNIWARVSDSARYITARFSPEAAAEWERIYGRRLTQHQTAIIRIKDFKLFFARVPVRGGNLTSSETLVLECNSAVLHGSLDEKRVGNPQDVTLNQDIKAWIEGLRQGGGNGNLLKLRRAEREKSKPMNESDKVVAPVLEQQTLETVVCKPTTMWAHRPKPAKTSTSISKTCQQPWKPHLPSLYEIPPDTLASLKTLPIEGEETTLKREDDTNSELESPRKKRHIANDVNLKDMDMDEQDDRSSQPLSGWSASEDEGGEEQSKPERQPQLVSPALPTSHKSPLSSLPPMSSYAKMEAPPKRPPSQDPRLRVRRKVPPPKQPQELTQSSGQGERVLAPASDTSMSQSQSQSQSQKRLDGHKPGTSPIRGWEGEGNDLVRQTTKRGMTRQVARKSSSNGQLNRDMITNRQQNERISHDRSNPEAKLIDRMSDDDRETGDRLLGDPKTSSPASVEKSRSRASELPPSKKDDNNSAHASPNGLQPVSTVTAMETLVQHNPGTWNEPSFMSKVRRPVGSKQRRPNSRLSGMRKGEERELGWLSWVELGNILEET